MPLRTGGFPKMLKKVGRLAPSFPNAGDCILPKGIEDACRRQASEAPEHRETMWLGWTSAANTHAASKATGISTAPMPEVRSIACWVAQTPHWPLASGLHPLPTITKKRGIWRFYIIKHAVCWNLQGRSACHKMSGTFLLFCLITPRVTSKKPVVFDRQGCRKCSAIGFARVSWWCSRARSSARLLLNRGD